MFKSAESKIKEGAAELLEPGEEILAAVIAQPRGRTQAVAGVLNLGAMQQAGVHNAAARAELVVEAPMALAVTDRRLLTIKISSPLGLGMGGNVKELLSAVPLAEVDAIESKRLAVGKVIVLRLRDEEIKLEAGAGANVGGLVDAFQARRAA